MTKPRVHSVSLVAICLLAAVTATAQMHTSATNAPNSTMAATPETDGTEGHSGPALDRATAEGLFRLAIELEKEGKLDAACDKYEEANRLQQDVSILVRLARCRKGQGKTATAWALFKSATRLATIQGHSDLVDPLAQYASELESRLSHLTIHIVEPAARLEITRDRIVVRSAQLDQPLPIDPGEHEITANAPGYKPNTVRVRIGDTADNQVITVPALQRLAPPPAPPATPTRHQPRAAANTWPWALGGFGATALLVGGTAGILALVNQHDASQCASQTSSCSDKTLWRAESRRDTATNVAWVSVPVGVVALGVATWMLLDGAQPKRPESGAAHSALRVSADNRGGQLSLQGRF